MCKQNAIVLSNEIGSVLLSRRNINWINAYSRVNTLTSSIWLLSTMHESLLLNGNEAYCRNLEHVLNLIILYIICKTFQISLTHFISVTNLLNWTEIDIHLKYYVLYVIWDYLMMKYISCWFVLSMKN